METMKYIVVVFLLVTIRIVAGDVIVGVDYVPVKEDKCLSTYSHSKKYFCDRIFKGTFQ